MNFWSASKVDSSAINKAIMGLAATLALYFGADKVKSTVEQPAKDNAPGINAAWATLVFNGQTIDWLGDSAVMAAAKTKNVSLSFVNITDESLEKLHLKPIIEGVGVPAIVFQAKDGQIVHIRQVKTLDDAVKQFDLINP